MVKLYRLMCKAEYDRVGITTPFSWQSKAKWFSDDIYGVSKDGKGKYTVSASKD